MPRPRPGYEYHEIVEQSDWNNHLARGSIDPGRNRVLIPTYRHWDVNAFYATPQNEYGGMSPRSYLRGKSAEECYRVGLDALRRLGVLK